jgi:RecB family exonuclease
LFYSAISRADGLLLLTRPTLAEDGEIWQPSPYWLESLRLFGLEDEQVPLYRRGNSRPMSEAASEHEVVFQAVRRGSLPQAYASIEPRLEPLRQARPLIEARLQAEPAGEYEGDLSLLTSILADQLGQGHSWSPSRLESFGTCPHYYLSSTLLGLQELEEPELGPDARQLGSLLHEILELGYQAASDPADPELVTAAVRELAAERFERAPQEFGFRPSPLWHIEAEQLTESLVESISGLAELGAGWQPFGYEAKFGIGGQPALEVETTEGTIQVRGVIDRLDRKGGQLRVIDYKTGGSHLSRSDLLQGRRLQLPLYALAAERALEAGEVTSGLYWNIRGGKAGSLKLESFNATWQGDQVEGVRGAYQVLHDHLSAFLAAIRTGQFQPKPPQGGCPDYCPASAWCWRYTPGFRR